MESFRDFPFDDFWEAATAADMFVRISARERYEPRKPPKISWQTTVDQQIWKPTARPLSNAESVSCPSLVTDHSKDDKEPPRPAVKSPNSADPTASKQILPTHESVDDVRSQVGAWRPESEPMLFRSTRQILSANPSYAEEIIEALKQMPEYRRTVLMHAEDSSGLLDDPGDDPGATDAASGDQDKRSSNASGNKPKKRRRHGDEGEDQDDTHEEGEGSGGGGTPRSNKRNAKIDERWACPYSLVYPQMLEINKFSTCRPPGSLKERSEWRLHLERHHSPDSKLKDPLEDNSIFYMDDQQWKEVQETIKSSDITRPREHQVRRGVYLNCYLAVWHIIFPASRFPLLLDPISPFHTDRQQIENLGQQGQVMFDAIWKVRAKRAVASGSIESELDYQPARKDLRTIVAEMFAIVTNSSPGASQWVANSTPEMLQDAAERSAWGSDQTSTALRTPSLSIIEANMVAEDTGNLSCTERPQDEQGFASSSTTYDVPQDDYQSLVQATSNKVPQNNQLPAYMPVTVMMLPGSYSQFTTPSLNPIHLLVAAPMNYSLNGSFPPIFEIPQTPALVDHSRLQTLPMRSFNDAIPAPNDQDVVSPDVGEALSSEQTLDFGLFLNEMPLPMHT